MKPVNKIKVILFNEKESEGRITKRFLSLFEDRILIKYANNNELKHLIGRLKCEDYKSKEVLILKDYKGSFYQLCPGTLHMICCNYKIINTCINCLHNCTYCYLNSYLNTYGIVQYTNIDKLYLDLDDLFHRTNPENIYRIGTGEFTDSLMMDEVTGIGMDLIERMSSFNNLMLELKTKSNNIDHLLNINNKGNAVLAWSLNTQRNITKYECGTASLIERIKAAQRACSAGFYLAFHFDPIIIYDGWKEDYLSVIDMLFSHINHERVVWISLGCFRYTPSFKDIIRDRFPDEELTIEEMFPGIDGKMRYLKRKRIDIYRRIKEYINLYTDKPFIYLCMESSDLWYTIFNKHYLSSKDLEIDFSNYLKKNLHNM